VPVAAVNKPIRVTELAWECLRQVLKNGDTVIDATAGTGQDTLFLASCVGNAGRVFAFDIQKQALVETANLLKEKGFSNNTTLINRGHEEMQEILNQKENFAEKIKAIMFNLGYFPGGDQNIITTSKTTLKALEAGLQLLAPGGLITLCLYPGHPGGRTEAAQVLQWCENLQDPFVAHHFQTLNRKTPPTLVLIQKTR
jgi:predicted methyltransferase